MQVSRIAMVWDYRSASTSLGIYCLRSLLDVAHVQVFLPDDVASVSRLDFDLCLHLSSETVGHGPVYPGPNACWPEVPILDSIRAASVRDPDCQWFVPDKKICEKLRGSDAAPAEWLPFACQPDIHRTASFKPIDLCWLGGGALVSALQPVSLGHAVARLGSLQYEEAATLIASAKLATGLERPSSALPFEVIACGAVLITGHADLEGCLRNGEHFMGLSETDSLADCLSELLGQPARIQKIAQAGRTEVLTRHTYRHRIEQLILAVENSRRVVVAVPAELECVVPSEPDTTPLTDHSPEPTTTDESDPARPLLDGITLCMIVRDSSGTLRPCLESIRPWVDQMVVVDTGSLDDTREFAKSLGAEVHEFPWCDDFSAARNESLRHARHRWLFWMDSDDTIDAGNGKQLRDLAAAASPAEVLGFVVKVHCPSPAVDGQNDVTVVDHVKLFPNRPDLRFEGRIHEQILPALRRAGGKVVWTDLFVTHSGADLSTDGQRRKIERDLRILEREYAERPNHPFVLFNLGMTYNEAGRPELAARHLQRCLDVAGPDESHLRKVYALLIEAQCRLGREDLASETCRQGLARFPADPELLFRAATAHHRSRRWQEAAQAYQRVLASREEPHFSSLDYGILGYKTRQNLATVYGELGSWASAEGQWRLVLRERPLLEAAHLGLLDALLAQGRHTAAQAHVEALHRRADCDYSLPELLSVYLLEKSGQLEQARRRLDDALRVTDAPCLHRVRCRLAFEHGTLAEGITAHERLLAIETDDPAVHCNLGTLLLRDHRPAEAERCFRASLRLRPNSPLAYLHLGYARMAQGAQDEARTAWLTAAQMDPGAEGVLEAQALLAEGQGAAVTVHGEVA